jgi:hypothetical protein
LDGDKAGVVMTEGKTQHNGPPGPVALGPPEPVALEKSADILQSTFEHYYKMAMDHHTKAATTSHILLIIVAAIITLVGLDKAICGPVDIGSAIGVILIALLAAMWAWKQHERYHYWENIASKYQEELIKIVPMLQPRLVYDAAAQESATKMFLPFFATTLQDRYLWPIVHGIIAVIGLGLLVISISNSPCG